MSWALLWAGLGSWLSNWALGRAGFFGPPDVPLDWLVRSLHN
jgi:hypothetical protein